ncbi:hypothetical protein DMI65_11820 [Escherichia coli]|nr:hypothetical protein [Escherichia coli]
MTGLKIAAGVATVVMVAIIALINGIIGGGRLVWFCQCLWKAFSAMCWPSAGMDRVDWSDANLAGSLIGQNWRLMSLLLISFRLLSANERHAGCQDHCHYLFALCGLQTLVLSVLSLERFRLFRQNAPEIAQLGLRALAAATLSNLMSATIAGFFIGLA